jgi:hypothetical protein
MSDSEIPRGPSLRVVPAGKRTTGALTYVKLSRRHSRERSSISNCVRSRKMSSASVRDRRLDGRDITNSPIGVPPLRLVLPDRVSPRVPLVVRPQSRPVVLRRGEPDVRLSDAQEALGPGRRTNRSRTCAHHRVSRTRCSRASSATPVASIGYPHETQRAAHQMSRRTLTSGVAPKSSPPVGRWRPRYRRRRVRRRRELLAVVTIGEPIHHWEHRSADAPEASHPSSQRRTASSGTGVNRFGAKPRDHPSLVKPHTSVM